MPKNSRPTKIESFALPSGRLLGRKYEIVSLLGAGWEGEVYRIRERRSGIERAAKCFFPHRNERNQTALRYARKLHKLKDCPMVIQYVTEETIKVQGLPVTVLISEYVEGEILLDFMKRQPGKILGAFQAIHLLYALVRGLEPVHKLAEYHGDLHAENIIIRRHGLSFDLKVLDFFIHTNSSKRENLQDDICDLIKIFYDSLGGSKRYAQQPAVIKSICCGLKRRLILKKFPKLSILRSHLESLSW